MPQNPKDVNRIMNYLSHLSFYEVISNKKAQNYLLLNISQKQGKTQYIDF